MKVLDDDCDFNGDFKLLLVPSTNYNIISTFFSKK